MFDVLGDLMSFSAQFHDFLNLKKVDRLVTGLFILRYGVFVYFLVKLGLIWVVLNA